MTGRPTEQSLSGCGYRAAVRVEEGAQKVADGAEGGELGRLLVAEQSDAAVGGRGIEGADADHGDVGFARALQHLAQARLGQQHVAHGGRAGEGRGGQVVALRAQRLGDARGGLVHVDLGAAADTAQERHDGEAGQVAAAQCPHAPVQRPPPADAQGLAGAQPVGQPGAEGHPQGGRQVGRVVRGRHDHGLLEPEAALQAALQRDAGCQAAVDLDLHQARLPADLQVAHHLDPADAEPVGDLGLGRVPRHSRARRCGCGAARRWTAGRARW